jgi:hypothetical protein
VQVIRRKHAVIDALLVASYSTAYRHLLGSRSHHEIFEIIDVVSRSRTRPRCGSVQILQKCTDTSAVLFVHSASVVPSPSILDTTAGCSEHGRVQPLIWFDDSFTLTNFDLLTDAVTCARTDEYLTAKLRYWLSKYRNWHKVSKKS